MDTTESLFSWLQGVGGDWKEEVPQMASTYGSAILTIAINTNQNMFDTFFAERSSKRSKPPKEWAVLYKKLVKSVDPEQWFFSYHNFRRSLYTGGIVGERAWCLQERQLSPRMIHLLDNGIMLWECPSLCATTATPKHFPFLEKRIATKLCKDQGGHTKLAMYQRYVDGEFQGKTGDNFLDYDNHLYFWHIMLRDINNRKLTFSTDNLAAIAGIAAQVHSNTGYTYLSGVWKEDIPRGLLWMRTPDRGAPHTQWKRFNRYQGPSWSWCSVDGPTQVIEFSEDAQMPIAVRDERDENLYWVNMVHDVDVRRAPPGANTHQLAPLDEGSHLAITGHLGRFRCSGEAVDPPRYAGRNIGSYVRDLGRAVNLSDLSRAGEEGEEEEAAGLHIQGAAVFDVPADCTARTVWCLLLVEAPEEPGNSAVALVLEPLSADPVGAAAVTRAARSFRRIGLAHLQLRNAVEWPPVWTACFGDRARVHIF